MDASLIHTTGTPYVKPAEKQAIWVDFSCDVQ
jgi:hypothetical protein